MANSLPGCPIVGFYNEEKEDFEEHNRIIDVSNGKFEIKDTTRPYGFVDLGAKVWFQKFLDDGMDEREYMMTEGWLWTGQYPECRRILSKGNNQSMELDEETLNASWSESENGKAQFFIINEAIISKLCTLGEANEPCFETASIGAPIIQFAFADGFKEQLFSMMNELKELLNKGGEKVFTRYAIEIGDALWTALYDYCVETGYTIESVCEDNEQKFAVLQDTEGKFYRLDFSINEEEAVAFDEVVKALEDYTPAEEPQFDAEAVAEYAKAKEAKKDEDEENDDEEEKCPECGKVKSECECEKDDDEDDEEKNKGKKSKYVLEEIQEYVELSEKYSALEVESENRANTIKELEAKVSELTEFKKKIEKAEKEKMIASFYMLSDDDKAEVVENIDTYSLEDIEAKLSIICVRNKVSFSLEDDKNDGEITFNLNDGMSDTAPAWVKALRNVAKDM